MFKTIIIVLAVTLGALIVMATVDKVTTELTKDEDKNVSLSMSKQSGIEVTLSGEVEIPGTYLIPEKSTLGDAINAAGGLNSNADSKAFNVGYILDKDASFYIAPMFDVDLEICEKVRGFEPWASCYLKVKQEFLKIGHAQIVNLNGHEFFVKNKINSFNNGYLGSHNDEERSKIR